VKVAVGGHRINPDEVEEVLMESGLLVEVAVVGRISGTSYIPPVKPILLVHDYDGLRISRIFGNTPPPYFQLFSSADALA
jgi:hypothetical protein